MRRDSRWRRRRRRGDPVCEVAGLRGAGPNQALHLTPLHVIPTPDWRRYLAMPSALAFAMGLMGPDLPHYSLACCAFSIQELTLEPSRTTIA